MKLITKVFLITALMTATSCISQPGNRDARTANETTGEIYTHHADISGDIFIYKEFPSNYRCGPLYEMHPPGHGVITVVASIPSGERLVEFKNIDKIAFSPGGLQALKMYPEHYGDVYKYDLVLINTNNNSLIWKTELKFDQKMAPFTGPVFWDTENDWLIICFICRESGRFNDDVIRVLKLSTGEELGGTIFTAGFSHDYERVFYGEGELIYRLTSDPASKADTCWKKDAIIILDPLIGEESNFNLADELLEQWHPVMLVTGDGGKIFFGTDSLSDDGNIMMFDTTTGEWQTLYTPEYNGVSYCLEGISADGSRLCLSEVTKTITRIKIYHGDIPRRIEEVYDKAPAFMDVESGEIHVLEAAFPHTDHNCFAITPSGKYILEFKHTWDIWVHDLENGTKTVLPAVREMGNSSGPFIPGGFNINS